MISSLTIKNFTAFSACSFNFCQGLNVIIGENAIGKSHALKLAYSLAWIQHEITVLQKGGAGQGAVEVGRAWTQRRIGEKLVAVFRPDTLGRLCRRGRGRSRAEVQAMFGLDLLEFSFATNSVRDVTLTGRTGNSAYGAPVFLPAKEALSLYPGFASLYEQRELSIDETYYDLCKLLSAPLLRGPRVSEIARIVQPLELSMGGRVRLDAGRFYLHMPGRGRMEISLVAEGFRKLAMLAYLAANGTLKADSTLYWDEPEANLNPKLMKHVAQALMNLTEAGVQVVVATQSLFMMKELSLEAERSKHPEPAKFFGLRFEEEDVVAEEGHVLADLRVITALDEALAQDDREQEHFFRETA